MDRGAIDFFGAVERVRFRDRFKIVTVIGV